jgi:hypothetical protein
MKTFQLHCCADNDRSKLVVGEDDSEIYLKIMNEDAYNLSVILTYESIQTLYENLGEWLTQRQNTGLGDK